VVVSFTHDCPMEVFLPGVAPTGRKVTLPLVVVVGFDAAAKVAHEHIYWDQASMLVQIGLLDQATLPARAPSRPSDCSTPACPPIR
jgi:carboxymethylenebutenolidase